MLFNFPISLFIEPKTMSTNHFHVAVRFMRQYHVKPKILNKRNFSNSNPSNNVQSPEGVEETGWNWKWKALGAVVVGASLPISIVSALKYDPETREVLEPLFPDQVEYVRQKVGFDKEDLRRLHYIRKQEAEYQPVVTTVIQFHGGKELILEVPSDQSFEEFRNSIGNHGEGRITSIDFKDGQVKFDSELQKSEAPEVESHNGVTELERELNVMSLWDKYSPNELSHKGSLMNAVSTDEGLALEDAKLLLEVCEKREKALEKEKITGLREIDDIDEEIKAIRARKKNLKDLYFRKKWIFF